MNRKVGMPVVPIAIRPQSTSVPISTAEIWLSLGRRCVRVLGLAVLLFTLGAPVSAQVAAEIAYAVAYVDVMPSARAAAVAALKQYREASRRDRGHVRIDVFEQVGRQGHFAVIEAWTDQAALDAHQAAAPARQLVDALQPIRVSGYDQRPYKPLSVGAALAAPSREAFHVVAHVDIGPGGAQADAPGLLRRLAEASRQEPGNMRFDVLQHSMRGNHFTVFEVWANQAALDTHAAAQHTRQYRDTLQPLSGSPLDERVYKSVE